MKTMNDSITSAAPHYRHFPRGGRIRALAVLLAGPCLIAGCGRQEAQAPPPGPPEVGVITVVAAPLALTQDLPGRTSAFHVAEVRARVSGIVEKRLFEEGGEVKQGQVLYQIDPAPYQASLKSAQGTLARAEANVASTRAQEERYRTLLADHAVSKQDYDNAVASFKGYEADVVSGQAGVQTAEINLGYTQVVSPITGRIGISQVTEGAYVQESAATLLATVQQLDPMYVDVTQPSSDLLRLKRELASGKLKSAGAGMARVKLILDDDSEYPVEGTLQLADVTVNQTTSSVTVRAIFPNPKDELLPGMFVRARLEEGISPDAILVPQLAVTHNQQGEPTAMVAGAAGHVELRVLKTPRAVGNQWLVSEGLKPGDLLIVDSLQRLRPGAAVKPVPAKLPPVLASAESPAN